VHAAKNGTMLSASSERMDSNPASQIFRGEASVHDAVASALAEH
jgi:hypothetical protein